MDQQQAVGLSPVKKNAKGKVRKNVYCNFFENFLSIK